MTKQTYKLINGDCIAEMKKMDANSIDSIVTDPPYEIGFMNKGWDNTGIAYNKKMWAEALRVLKPGGHMLAFSSTRTYHRMVCAIEDSGFEIRDQLAWIYGSGFPKSQNVGKMIAKKEKNLKNTKTYMPDVCDDRNVKNSSTGSPRCQMCKKSTGPVLKKCPENRSDCIKPWEPDVQDNVWNGWGTALKPAQEPIVLARKPISESTIAKNVIKYGTGAIDIDNSRVPTGTDDIPSAGNRTATFGTQETISGGDGSGGYEAHNKGRWPANIIHDGSEEVLNLFPEAGNGWKKNYGEKDYKGKQYKGGTFGGGGYLGGTTYNDNGSAARFFYCAKANKQDRNDKNNHPTVKPTMLMQYLVRMITPIGGTILDPFNGSGSTGKAAMILGKYNYVGIDLSADYISISKARIENAINTTGKIIEDTAIDTEEEETNFFIE